MTTKRSARRRAARRRAVQPGHRTGNLVSWPARSGREPETGELPDGVEAQTERVMQNITAMLDGGRA